MNAFIFTVVLENIFPIVNIIIIYLKVKILLGKQRFIFAFL